MPHTVRSRAEKKGVAAGRGTDVEAVWYAEARAGWAVLEDATGLCSGIEAVAIDSRERTRSKGYVLPTDVIGSAGTGSARDRFSSYIQTDVIPASAPAHNRVGVSSGVAP